MGLNIGTNAISDMYAGGNACDKIYKGSDLLFDANSKIQGLPPIYFQSRANAALKNYRVYGVDGGAGVQTSGTELAGYKIPLTVTSGEHSGTYPLYIGSTKLGAEEYADYEEQKVYKRTKNLWNGTYSETGEYLSSNGTKHSDSKWNVTNYIPVEGGQSYIFCNMVGVAAGICYYDVNNSYLSGVSVNATRGGYVNITFTAPSTATYVRFCILLEPSGTGTISFEPNKDNAMAILGSTPPETYIPYLQPTDPPAPLPAIIVYKGNNTITSSITVGEIYVKGRISNQPLGYVMTQIAYDELSAQQKYGNKYFAIDNNGTSGNLESVYHLTQTEYDELTEYDVKGLYIIETDGTISNVYVGETELDALMLGSELVWSRLPPEIEIQKLLPIKFKAYGRPLTGYKVYGSNTRGVYISQGTVNLPLKLNGIDIPISLNMPLFENEYIDFETQGVYQMGNWINRNFIQGYIQTNPVVIITNTEWGVTFPKAIPLPTPLLRYTSKYKLELRSDIPGLEANETYFKGEDITTANCTEEYDGWTTLPMQLMPYNPATTHVSFTFRRNSSWAPLSPNELEGHVWIQCENLTSEYHAYSTLVKTPLSLPQITPQNGTNIISYDYEDQTTPVMMIKGNINALPD